MRSGGGTLLAREAAPRERDDHQIAASASPTWPRSSLTPTSSAASRPSRPSAPSAPSPSSASTAPRLRPLFADEFTRPDLARRAATTFFLTHAARLDPPP